MPGLTRSFQSPHVPWLGWSCWVSVANTRSDFRRPMRFLELMILAVARSVDADLRRERSAVRSRALVSADIAAMMSYRSRDCPPRLGCWTV